MRSIVVATPDVIGSLMAGPGIRAWHFADELAGIPGSEVTVIGRWTGEAKPRNAHAIEWGTAAATRAIRSATVVIGQPHPVLLRSHGARRIFDLFDPVVLELDELYGAQMRLRQRVHQRLEWARLERALDEGDLLIAATPRQRDFYWGIQRSRSPISPEWMERWDVIPFGAGSAPTSEPVHPARVVWSGGLWGWLDPELALDAAELLGDLDARIVIAGGTRPGAASKASPRAAALRDRAAGMGSRVEWLDAWVPYEDRWSVLSGARVALALHKRTVEAEFSIRIRLFDAIAAGVPMIVTRGGYVADLVEAHGLGIVVEPGDARGVAAAIRQMCTDDALHGRSREACRAVAQTMGWADIVAPLRRRLEQWLG